MMRVLTPRSVCETTIVFPREETPIVRNRRSPTEWSGSGKVQDKDLRIRWLLHERKRRAFGDCSPLSPDPTRTRIPCGHSTLYCDTAGSSISFLDGQEQQICRPDRKERLRRKHRAKDQGAPHLRLSSSSLLTPMDKEKRRGTKTK